MENTRKRNYNWENEERALLRGLVGDRTDIIHNKNTDSNTNKRKRRAWEEVWVCFNKANRRRRSLVEIKTQWKTMKLKAKHNGDTHEEIATVAGYGDPLCMEEDRIQTSTPEKPFEESSETKYTTNTNRLTTTARKLPRTLSRTRADLDVDFDANSILKTTTLKAEEEHDLNMELRRTDLELKRTDLELKRRELELKRRELEHKKQEYEQLLRHREAIHQLELEILRKKLKTGSPNNGTTILNLDI